MDKSENFSEKSDSELVDLVLQDQDYFLYIVKRYKDKIFRYIRRLSNLAEEEIEDVLQDIFIKVYLNLNAFNNDLKFSSWIYRIAHNEIIDNYRRRQSRPKTVELDIESDYIKELTDDFDLLEETVHQDLVRRLNQAINSLDIKFREIIILKFIEEKNYKEISDIIRKPVGTVASRINKAKKDLYKIMRKNIKHERK